MVRRGEVEEEVGVRGEGVGCNRWNVGLCGARLSETQTVSGSTFTLPTMIEQCTRLRLYSYNTGTELTG